VLQTITAADLSDWDPRLEGEAHSTFTRCQVSSPLETESEEAQRRVSVLPPLDVLDRVLSDRSDLVAVIIDPVDPGSV